MICNMILTEHSSVSSIIASGEEEENVITIDRHNWVCYKRRTIDYFIHETQLMKLSYRAKMHRRLVNLNNLITGSDATCKSKLRMKRNTFTILCEMLRNIRGLNYSRYMSLHGRDCCHAFVYIDSSVQKIGQYEAIFIVVEKVWVKSSIVVF